MFRKFICLTVFILTAGLLFCGQAAAETIYYDDFDGSAGVDVNGTTPDISATGASWVAGADFDADGNIIWDSNAFGDSAYLPFEPVSGYIYTLSATIQAYSGPNVPDNNWAAVGFTQFNTNPESRFFNDNGERNPVYWAMTRTNSTDANDQTFTGAGTAGGQDSDTSSADQIMIVIDATQSTWVAEWYYNSILKRTENVSEALKDNFQYIAVTTSNCSAFIDEITLARQIGPFAADPGPADEALGVPREPLLYWTPGDGADKHNVYFGTDFDDVNDADTGSGLLVSEEQDANSYGPLDTLEYNMTYYWRVDEVEAGGSPVHKGQVWTFTTELEAGIVTLYYDNFDGSAGTDLDGTIPDITPTGTEVWDAGTSLNADGSFANPTFTAALPFTWQTGAVYELSATLNSHTGDFAAIAFMNDAPNVAVRINDNSPRLWMLVRGTDSAAADQAFLGPGTGGFLGDSSTSSALTMKVRIEMVSTTQWNVFWYFDGSLEFQQTVNPSTAGIDLDYISFGVNGMFGPVAGDIVSFRLVVIPQALNPSPPDGELAYATDVQLQWQGGIYAVTHDVYLGTDFDDVNDADRDTPLGVLLSQDQSPTSYMANSLTAGETYYWRIDGVRSDGFTIDKGPVWSFTVEPQHAYFPSPRDGAQYVTEDTDLYWTPGSEADKHDIYFDTDFDDVNDATRSTHPGLLHFEQDWDSNSYDPGTLSIGETYYWRIDDVETGGSPIHKGPVWSFQTIPNIPVTDPHLLGWWSFDEGEGDLALDWSGHGNHGTLVNGPQWAEGRVDTALRFDGYTTYVDLPIGDEMATLDSCTVAAWVNFPSIGVNWQRIFDFGQDTSDYMYLAVVAGPPGSPVQFAITTEGSAGEFQLTGPVLSSGWHHVAVAINGDFQDMVLFIDGAEAGYSSTSVIPSDLGATVNNFLARSQANDSYYVGLLDEVQLYDYALTEEDLKNTLSFNKAWLPDPPDDATGVYRYPTLSWEPGRYAADTDGHKLYFSSDFNDVNERLVSPVVLTDPCYVVPTPPAPLESLGVYYWRVDEVNNSHPDVNWPGDIWTFTVRDEALIDDFEGYSTSDLEPTEADDLRMTWIDGEWDFEEPTPQNPDGEPGSSGGFVQLATDDNDAWDQTFGGAYEHYQPADTVRNGSDSMKFHFDNDGEVRWIFDLYYGYQDLNLIYDAPQYSEARAAVVDAGIIDAGEGQQSLNINNDWSGYKVMRISYYGDANNADMESSDKLFVTLADDDVDDVNAQVQYNDDVDSLSEEWWHDWYIPLSAFTDDNGNLDMENIYRIHVGVGHRVNRPSGGTGLIFIDDIQLYATGVCVSGTVAEDFTGDCEVDNADLDMMNGAWLNDVTTTPVIKIDASSLTPGAKTNIANQGSFACNFVDFDSADANTNPVVETVDGEQCITFDVNQLLISDANAPDRITGTGPFTVVYKVYNPEYADDEEVFNWAKRGTENRYASVCIGSSVYYGAGAFWGVGDIGFSQLPDAGEWHEVIIIYEGRTDGMVYVWVDNHLDNFDAKNLDFWPDCPMMLGAAYDGDPYIDAIPDGLTPGYKFTGSLAYLAVYDYAVPIWELEDWVIGDAIPANPINLYDSDSVIDFKDLAVMGLKWMETPILLGD